MLFDKKLSYQTLLAEKESRSVIRLAISAKAPMTVATDKPYKDDGALVM